MTRFRTAESLRPEIRLEVNGRRVVARPAAHLSLVRLLRDELRLTGTKVGCYRGQCGACTVLIDGVPHFACLVLAARCDGTSILTVEGLASTDGTLHPVQEAFIAEHGFQCGYCTPGMLMSAVALLAGSREIPTEEEVGAALSGHVCRCGNYRNIVAAIQATAREVDG